MESNFDVVKLLNEDEINIVKEEFPEYAVNREAVDIVEKSTSDVKNEVIEMNDENECKLNVTVGDLYEESIEFIKTEEIILKDEKQDDSDFSEFQMNYAVINTNPVPIGTSERAARTLPKGTLELRPSIENRLGIYSLMHLQKGVRFGPYEGKLTIVESTEGYCWKLENGKLVDESDEAHSNYLRYINRANDVSEQNLEAFQCNEKLYYRTSRDVTEGEELLIYFDNSMEHSYYRPPEENLDEEIYTCQFCLVGMKVEEQRDRHQKFCQYRDVTTDVDDGMDESKPVVLTRKYVIHNSNDIKNRKGIQNEYNLKPENILEGTVINFETGKSSIHEQKRVFKCTDCDFETSFKSSLSRHKNNVHERKDIFKCTDCDFETHTKYNIACHKRCMHERKDLFKCTDCPFETSVKNYMVRHKRKVHERKNIFKCTDCDFTTHVKWYLRSHISRRHERKDIFKCTDCDFECYARGDLLSHKYRMHERKNVFKCRGCDYETHSKRYILDHTRRMHQRKNVHRTRTDIETHVKCNM